MFIFLHAKTILGAFKRLVRNRDFSDLYKDNMLCNYLLLLCNHLKLSVTTL